MPNPKNTGVKFAFSAVTGELDGKQYTTIVQSSYKIANIAQPIPTPNGRLNTPFSRYRRRVRTIGMSTGRYPTAADH